MNKFLNSVVKDVLKQFFVQLIGINGLTLASQLTRLMDVLAQFGLNLENILLPLIFLVVTFLPLTIPLALFFAIVVVFYNLNQSGELVAAQSIGLSPYKLVFPLMIIALFLFVSGAITGMYVDPWGQKEFRRFFIKKSQTELDSLVKVRLKSGIFTDQFLNHIFYAEHFDRENSTFRNLILSPKKDQKNQFVLFAPRGKITGSVESGDLSLQIEQPETLVFSAAKNEWTTATASHLSIDLLKIFQSEIAGGPKNLPYLTYYPGEMQQFIKQTESQFTRHSKSKKPNPKILARLREKLLGAQYIFHFRMAGSFVIFGMTLLACAIVIGENTRSRSFVFVKAIVVVLISYLLIMGLKWVAENGFLPAFISVWLANFIVLLVGFYSIHRRQNKISGG